MIKLMVVDDEPIIRDGLANGIDWERLDVSVVGTASNGRDGLAKAIKEKPDIVITDIRMPVSDGISLAKELKAKLPRVRVIFLTGYGEFEYAREAVRIGAADYLLKPVNIEALTALVGRLSDEIRIECAAERKLSQKTVLLKENLPLMRNRCVKRFFGGELSEAQFRKQAYTLGMEFLGEGFQVVILCIDYYYQMLANGEREGALLKYAMSNIAEEILGKLGTVFLCDEEEARLMVLLETGEETRRIAGSCREIQFYMRKYYGISVSVGIGKRAEGIAGLTYSYESAQKALEERIRQGSSQIIVEEKDREGPMGHAKLFLDLQEERELTEAVKLLDGKRVYDALERFFKEYVLEQSLNRRETEQFCIYLILIIMRQMEYFSIRPETALGRNYDYHHEISKYETAGDLEMWMRGIYGQALSAMEQQRTHKYKGIVANGMAYAMEHFAEAIQIGGVAKSVYVTPNYFSRVFKEETGENFTDWLNSYRVEQAKRRMDTEPETKVYTIAEECGFSDYKYFAFIFKKYTGYTPTAYKNR